MHVGERHCSLYSIDVKIPKLDSRRFELSSPPPAYDPAGSSRVPGSARFVPEPRRVWCSMSPRMTVTQKFRLDLDNVIDSPPDSGQAVGNKSFICTLMGRRVR